MTMQTLLARSKYLCYLLAGALLATVVPPLAHSQSTGKVDNVRATWSPTSVYIYYTLSGPEEQVYDVTLTMKSRTNASFQYKPKNVSGDIGPNVFTGIDWRITWNYAKEFPQGLKKDDYYFVLEARVVADRVASGGISPALWIAGGAVVAGGVVALLLLNKKDETPVTPTPGFPQPPGRP